MKKIHIILFLFFSLRLLALDDCEEQCEVPKIKTDAQADAIDIHQTAYEEKVYLYFFHSYDCHRCEKMKDLLSKLEADYPYLVINSYEIKKEEDNQTLFSAAAELYGTKPSGVPAVFIGTKSMTGYNGESEAQLRNEITALHNGAQVSTESELSRLPFLEKLSIASVPLLPLSVYIGLLDGFNPCAMWVLVFLLGLLLRTKERKRMAMVGLTFVIASGAVYFLFMTAWLNFFLLIGISRLVTIILGVAAIILALINIKELFWYKQGLSLMIPESVKPKIFKKAGKIIRQKNLLLAIGGTAIFAFFVNLIELGCTAGLPALFTRVISIRNVATGAQYFYMLIYNLAYVVPLALIVSAFVFSMKRFTMTETHGKILKGASGIIMFTFGIMLLVVK